MLIFQLGYSRTRDSQGRDQGEKEKGHKNGDKEGEGFLSVPYQDRSDDLQ